MTKHKSERDLLIRKSPHIQMGIAGFSVVSARDGVPAAYTKVREVHLRAQAYSSEAPKEDMSLRQERELWLSRSKALSGENDQANESERLTAIGENERHNANGMFKICDAYTKMSDYSFKNKIDGSHIKRALEQRAQAANEIGVRSLTRSVVALEGIEGVMKRGDITEKEAFEKIKAAQSVDIMERRMMENSRSSGAVIDGLKSREEFKKLSEEGGVEAAKQMHQLRGALIHTAFADKSDRQDRIKKAALLSHLDDVSKGDYDSKQAKMLDREILGMRVSSYHPLVKSMKAARIGMQTRQNNRDSVTSSR